MLQLELDSINEISFLYNWVSIWMSLMFENLNYMNTWSLEENTF